MTASDAIAEALDYLDDPDQTVHTQPKILRALNRALTRISVRSRSITVNRFHRIVADEYEYSLPRETLEVRRARYAHTEQTPPLTRKRYSYVETAARAYSGVPRMYAFAQRAAAERGVATVTEVTTNQSFRIDGSTVANVKPGDILTNLTAALPEASIFEVSGLPNPTTPEEEAALNIVTLDFIGGSGRGMQVGDSVRIVSPDTKGFSIAIAPRPSTVDVVGVESLSVFLVIRHPEITQFLIDNDNDELSIDSDLEDMVVYKTCQYASFAGEGRQDAQYWKDMADDEFDDNIANVRSRVAQALSSWENDYGYGYWNEDVSVKPQGGSYNDVVVR